MRRGWRSVAGCACGAIGTGASLILLLQHLADHGFDRLLIGRRHRGVAHCGNSLPDCSATMKAAYQSGQFASRCPIGFSCTP
jgi:hypothetical protein